MLTKQIEFRPPEKHMRILDLPFTFIVFYKVSRHLYSMFFKRHALQIGSLLLIKAAGSVLHFLQMTIFLRLIVFS